MLSFALALLAAQAAPQDPLAVTPRVVSAAELRGRGFDASWEFPRHRSDGTPYPGVGV